MSTPGLGLAPTAHRDGNLLVIPSGATLPPNCIKCGKPVSGNFLTKTFRWHSRWLYLLIFIGLIAYVIVALIVQKKARISLPLCTEDRLWRSRMGIATAALLIGSIPASFLLAALGVDGGWIALTAVMMALAGLVTLGLLGGSFSPVYIDNNLSKFKGAGGDLLALLPSVATLPH